MPVLKRAHHHNISITGNATTKIKDTTVKLSSAQKLMLESRVKAWHAQSALPRYMPRTYDSAMVNGGKYATHIHMHKKPKLHKPTDEQTCIEAPFRLIISPSIYGAWAHSDTPVMSPKTERTEMWHTRLGVRSKDKDGKFYVDERGDNERRTVRAIWTRDKEFDKDNWEKVPDHLNDKPFRMSLDAADRHNIVHLSCNYYIPFILPEVKIPKAFPPYTISRVPIQEVKIPRAWLPQKMGLYKPLPIQVEQLMLTSLGAWMNVHGAWDPPGDLTVEEWRHRGTMGRDNYVRVVYQGYLFPFGHRASLIKVTERKFHPKSEYPNIPGNVAYLRQRMFIVVREPDKIFVNPTLKTPDGHYYDLQMPFTRVRITTLVTPNLDPPEDSDYDDKEQSLFWPRVGENDFLFHLIAECTDGKEVEFTAPLVFADSDVARKEDLMQTVKTDYETNTDRDRENRRKRPMNGQNVIFADSAEPGDTNSECNSNTRFEVESLTFGAEIPDDTNLAKLGSDHPRFYPAVRKAKIFIPAIKHLVGNNFKATVIKYHETYLKYGFDDTSENNGEVFAQLDTDNEIPLNFNSKGDRSGGLVKPNMKITGLSRLMGPVAGDLNKLRKGEFNPTDFFGGMEDAKMFGVIPLKEIVEGLDSELATQPDRVPKFIMENQTAMNAFLQDLEYLKENVESISSDLGTLAENLIGKNGDNGDIEKIIKNIGDLSEGKTPDTNFEDNLKMFNNNLSSLRDELPGLTVSDDIKRALDKSVTEFSADLGDDDDDVKNFVDKFVNVLHAENEQTVKFEWSPKVKNWPDSDSLFIASNNDTLATLTIAVEIRAQSSFKPEPTVDIACSLQNFTLNLIGDKKFIKIRFQKLEFFSRGGKKADVNVVMAGIEFVGVLSFVEALRTLIPLDGFSDPPSMDVTSKGIAAGYSVALPDIAIGVFSLQNLSLGAGFTVPFQEDPLSVRFNFCERHNKFLLTVSMFGGGGFFGITLDPQGVQILEAALEFGASISIDFGVASGGVYVMAGIYFKIEGVEADLMGYYRMGGVVDVLRIISASIELYLGLEYESRTGKCVGSGSLTIEVKVFLFSKDVTIKCERKFAGSSGDPSFKDLMEPYQVTELEVVKPWHEYCTAFA